MKSLDLPAREKDHAAEPDPAFGAPKSLHDNILARLREYIVEGNLEDGARIPERELCLRFGISRTPLREALCAQ